MKPYGQPGGVTCACCANDFEILPSRFYGGRRLGVNDSRAKSRRPAKRRARAVGRREIEDAVTENDAYIDEILYLLGIY